MGNFFQDEIIMAHKKARFPEPSSLLAMSVETSREASDD